MLKTKLPLGFEPVNLTLKDEYKKVRYFFYEGDKKYDPLKIEEKQILSFMDNFINSSYSFASLLEKFSDRDQFRLKSNVLAVLSIAYKSWAVDMTEVFGPKEYWETDEFCSRMNKKFE